MNQIEKFLFIILILSVLTIVTSFFLDVWLVWLYGGAVEIGQIKYFTKGLISIILLFKILVNLCVAFWLFKVSKEYDARSWGWFIFGLFFGIMALIFFYLIRIHDMISLYTSKGAET